MMRPDDDPFLDDDRANVSDADREEQAEWLADHRVNPQRRWPR